MSDEVKMIATGRADVAAQQTEVERIEGKVCRNCGKELFQTPGMKTRKFCSKQCREAWWRNNPDKLHKISSVLELSDTQVKSMQSENSSR